MSDVTPLAEAKASEIRANFAHQGLMRMIGAEMASLAPGRCVITVPFSDLVNQQHGFFHGGIIGAIADNAAGYAALTLLPLGSDALTLEYTINFLRPAAGDRLVAEGTVLRAGRSICVSRVDVLVERDGQRALCAAAQQSIMRAPDSSQD